MGQDSIFQGKSSCIGNGRRKHSAYWGKFRHNASRPLVCCSKRLPRLWFTYGREDDYVLCVRSIQGYIEKWIMPFLDDYASVNSLANYFEIKDERIPAQRHFYIYVAAAFILLQQPAKSMQVLESKFGKAGPRRDYAKAFKYVEDLIR